MVNVEIVPHRSKITVREFDPNILDKQADVRLRRNRQEVSGADVILDLGNKIILAEPEDIDGHLAGGKLDAGLKAQIA